MHPLYAQANGLTREVIGAGIEVHRTLGPGLLESIYERCLLHVLELRGDTAVRQQAVQVTYKQITFEESLWFDLLVTRNWQRCGGSRERVSMRGLSGG